LRAEGVKCKAAAYAFFRALTGTLEAPLAHRYPQVGHL